MFAIDLRSDSWKLSREIHQVPRRGLARSHVELGVRGACTDIYNIFIFGVRQVIYIFNLFLVRLHFFCMEYNCRQQTSFAMSRSTQKVLIALTTFLATCY